MTASSLTPESLGLAPTRLRMVDRRVLVVGGGQTTYDVQEQPVGNGRAIAQLLAREGAQVMVADRNEDSAAETVALISKEGGAARSCVVDVNVPHSIEAMIDATRTELGGIDGLVYNVGIPGPVGFEDTTPEAWDAVIDANLRGAMLSARAALPAMEPHASIVFISSIGAVRGVGRMIAYDSSKAGLASLVRATAIARKDDHVRANIVMPGLIDTGLGRSAQQGLPERASIPVPLGRRGTAWEVAYATLFLLSGEAAYITGQTLAVDGGKTTL